MTFGFYQTDKTINRYTNSLLSGQQNKSEYKAFASKPQETQTKGLLDSYNELDKATSSSKKSGGKKELSDHENDQLATKLINKLSGYKIQAMNGSTRAITNIEALRDGSDDDIQRLSNAKMQKVSAKASTVYQSVMDSAQTSPKLLNALMRMSNADPKDSTTDQQSKSASYQLTKMMNENKLDIDRDVKPLLKDNPKTVLKALDGLCKSNIPREKREQIAALMSDFAKTHGTSEAGDIATKSLHNIARQEGQNGVLDQAFKGLTSSAISGNGNAVFSLEKMANENLSSKNKAGKAINGLSQVAKHNPDGSTGFMAIKSLQKTALKQSGNSTGLEAKSALFDIKNDQQNKKANNTYMFA
ncbi:MAG: hypothetical protein AB7V50_08470 [Vampirovibrionia bacterium]